MATLQSLAVFIKIMSVLVIFCVHCARISWTEFTSCTLVEADNKSDAQAIYQKYGLQGMKNLVAFTNLTPQLFLKKSMGLHHPPPLPGMVKVCIDTKKHTF